ncbi:flavin reductase family protein [Streptomyces prunicolor]|uniref:flavin reductase family protein n=1 Tax=Streptomyces prunicolor TaxID=67348 RepID=UPI0037D49168
MNRLPAKPRNPTPSNNGSPSQAQRHAIALDTGPLDPAALRRAYGCFPSGVTAVCALLDGKPIGMAASSFTSVSLSPPLVSPRLQDSSRTWPKLHSCARLGVSVLAATHDGVCVRLSRRDGDRFAGVQGEPVAGGAVFVHGAAAWLDCSVEAELPAGDHTIALLRIHALRSEPETPPLVFHASRFHELAATD